MAWKFQTKQPSDSHPAPSSADQRPDQGAPSGGNSRMPRSSRISLAIGGAVFAIVLAIAFYYSPMHFGLDRWRAKAAFDQGVRHDTDNKIDQALEQYDRALARSRAGGRLQQPRQRSSAQG
jgi:hypothetical protein